LVVPGVGVGNGICTADCTVNTSLCGSSGICVAIDVGADGSVTRALCFESCAIGPNPPAPPVAKCHSRQDVVCEPLDRNETLFGCIPICLTDADCAGRKCDLASGLCVNTPRPGKTIGSGCTVISNQTNNECAGGLCLPIEATSDGGSTPGVCSSFCRLNTLEACNFRSGIPISSDNTQGACVYPWGPTGYNTGDLGLCIQLCDAPNDCSYQAADWVCRTDITLGGWGHSICLVPASD
jgi:hypothetical protein